MISGRAGLHQPGTQHRGSSTATPGALWPRLWRGRIGRRGAPQTGFPVHAQKARRRRPPPKAMSGGGVGSRALFFGARLDPPPEPLSARGGPRLAALHGTPRKPRRLCFLSFFIYPTNEGRLGTNTIFPLVFPGRGPFVRRAFYLSFFMVLRARRRAGGRGGGTPLQ